MPVSPDYTVLRETLASRLGERALAHCTAVADTARAIAGSYGVDPDMAQAAGLLHDWSREMTAEELLSAAETHGIETTAVDVAVPYLLHAKTGAIEIRKAFPDLPEEVVRSVELHTMGATEMSDLDRVVYIADMIEPTRTFSGVDDLREAVGEVELSELFVRAYARSVIHLLKKRRRIHPETVEVWNTLVAEEQR